MSLPSRPEKFSHRIFVEIQVISATSKGQYPGPTQHYFKASSQNCEKRPFVMSVCPSVGMHGTTRLPLDGFLWNFISENFSKICRENSSYIKIGQEYRVLYMNTNIHFWPYLAHFFLEWEMFHTKVVEKIKTRILSSVTLFRKSCPLWDNVEKIL
jgi:hypothetical protein